MALEHIRGSPTITTGDCVESVLLLSSLVLFLFLIFYFILLATLHGLRDLSCLVRVSR